MVFLAPLGVNLHVWLCGDLQVASAQALDFLDMGQKSSFPDWKMGSTGKSFPDGYRLYLFEGGVPQVEQLASGLAEEDLHLVIVEKP